MRLGLRFREELQQVAGGYLVEELDAMLSSLQGFYKEHDAEGGHTNITPNLVTLAADKVLDADAVLIKTESVALHNISNSTTETSVFEATITHPVEQGDLLLAFYDHLNTNDTGANQNIQFDLSYGGVEGTTINRDLAPGGDGNCCFVFTCIRGFGGGLGGDIGIGTSSTDMRIGVINAPDSNLWATGGGNIVGPDFRAGQSFAIRATLETASTDLSLAAGAGAMLHFRLKKAT